MRRVPGCAPQSRAMHRALPASPTPTSPQYLGLPGFTATAGDLGSPPTWVGDQQPTAPLVASSRRDLGSAELAWLLLPVPSAVGKAAICFSFIVFLSRHRGFPRCSASEEVTASPSECLPTTSPCFPLGRLPYRDFLAPSPKLGRAEPSPTCQG